MYVSVPNKLDNFKYYDGRCALDLQSVHWPFYKEADPDSGQAMIRTNWQIIDETNRTLTFTNVLAGDAGLGDVLTYEVAGNDLSISFYDAKDDLTSGCQRRGNHVGCHKEGSENETA